MTHWVNPPQQPSNNPPGYGTVRSRIACSIFVAALFAYAQRHNFVTPSDAMIAFTIPLIALSLGVVAGFRLHRIFDTTFRSNGWAFVAVLLMCIVQFGSEALIKPMELRKLYGETLPISLLFFFVAAVIPLVNGHRK